MKEKFVGLLKHPLMSGSAVMMGGAMAVNVLNYVYHLLMGRMLGPADYGVLASIFSLYYIVAIVPASTSVAIVRFISSAPDTRHMIAAYRTLRRVVFILATVLALLMLVVSVWVAGFLRISDVRSVLMMAPVMWFSVAILVNQASLQGLLKFWGYVVPNILSSVVRLVGGVILVWLGWRVFGAMIGLTLSLILGFLYSERMVDFLKEQKSSLTFNLKKFVSYVLPALLQSLAFTSLFTADVLLVKHYFASDEAGLYAALSMLGRIIFFAASPIASVMFPIVSGRSAKGDAYGRVLLSALGITCAITVGVVGVYALLPDLSIGILYGQAYLAAKPGLVLMGMFLAFYTVSSLLTNFFLSIGKTKVVVLPLVACVVQVGLIVMFHSTIWQVIRVSMVVTGVLLVSLLGGFSYNWIENGHGQKREEE